LQPERSGLDYPAASHDRTERRHHPFSTESFSARVTYLFFQVLKTYEFLRYICRQAALVLAHGMYHPAVILCVMRAVSAVQQWLLVNQKQHQVCETAGSPFWMDLGPLLSADRINNLHY